MVTPGKEGCRGTTSYRRPVEDGYLLSATRGFNSLGEMLSSSVAILIYLSIACQRLPPALVKLMEDSRFYGRLMRF